MSKNGTDDVRSSQFPAIPSEKIEEILEISLDDSMEYLDVVNCILVKRLMFN